MLSTWRNALSGRYGLLVAYALGNVIWGIAFPLTKPALETIPPFTFTLLRFLVALLALWPFAGKRALELLRGPDGRRLAVMGLLGMCIAQVAQTLALKWSTASDISLLSITAPLWIALLARLWLGERIGRRGALGFAVAVVGLVLIFWPRDGGDLGMYRILGDAVFMITGFTWACYCVMGREIMSRLPPAAATVAAGIVGIAGIIPFSAYELLSGASVRFTLVGIGGVLYGGILVTALGFTVLFRTLARMEASDAAIVMYLQPLAGVLIAWLFLGDQLTRSFLVGGAAVLAAVGLVTFGQSVSPSGKGGATKATTETGVPGGQPALPAATPASRAGDGTGLSRNSPANSGDTRIRRG